MVFKGSKIYFLLIQSLTRPLVVIVVHKITSPPILKETESVL